MNNYQKYFINGKKYRNKKDSWIDLTEIQKIKIKNIQSPYIKLSQIDIKKIEKRIWISQNLEDINKILEFFVEINIQNNTIKKIYQHVRNLLYSSIA